MNELLDKAEKKAKFIREKRLDRDHKLGDLVASLAEYMLCVGDGLEKLQKDPVAKELHNALRKELGSFTALKDDVKSNTTKINFLGKAHYGDLDKVVQEVNSVLHSLHSRVYSLDNRLVRVENEWKDYIEMEKSKALNRELIATYAKYKGVLPT